MIFCISGEAFFKKKLNIMWVQPVSAIAKGSRLSYQMMTGCYRLSINGCGVL